MVLFPDRSYTIYIYNHFWNMKQRFSPFQSHDTLVWFETCNAWWDSKPGTSLSRKLSHRWSSSLVEYWKTLPCLSAEDLHLLAYSFDCHMCRHFLQIKVLDRNTWWYTHYFKIGAVSDSPRAATSWGQIQEQEDIFENWKFKISSKLWWLQLHIWYQIKGPIIIFHLKGHAVKLKCIN